MLDERHTGHIRGVCKAPVGFLENTGVTWSWSGGSQRCRSQLCQMPKFCFCRLLPGLCCSRHMGGEQPHRGVVERQGLRQTQSHGRVAHQKATEETYLWETITAQTHSSAETPLCFSHIRVLWGGGGGDGRDVPSVTLCHQCPGPSWEIPAAVSAGE